jgi:hypothetical protein
MVKTITPDITPAGCATKQPTRARGSPQSNPDAAGLASRAETRSSGRAATTPTVIATRENYEAHPADSRGLSRLRNPATAATATASTDADGAPLRHAQGSLTRFPGHLS